MSAPEHTERHATKLEMAHVLFMDIVGYSKLPMDHQEAVLHTLQAVVSSTPEFQRAQSSNEIIRLPTGDGMALVFFEDAEAAARCALEVSRALKSHPEILLRMGLHSGPVYRVTDINANQNVAGGGINIAQRVMDCGDAGHILASQSVADVLGQLSIWKASLHNLGEAEVKHGVRVHLYNLYTNEAGNAALPKKVAASKPTVEAGFKPAQESTRFRRTMATGTTILLIGLLVGGWLIFSRKAHALTDKDTIVLADFANSTGDPIFDDTLKTALAVALRQSPFLNLLSDDRVGSTLNLMTRPADTPLTPKVTREVCQRAHSKAYIAGSIATLGSEYVLGLRAVSCQSGDTLAQEQALAASKEKVLNALGEAASKLRSELGESLATVQKFDVPLAEATTPSLDALKAYSRMDYERAIELDPNFALGYWMAGNMSNQDALQRKYLTRAFQLREHASEREKQTIAGGYYMSVTGELDKAERALREVVESYPRLPEFESMDVSPHVMLGGVYMEQGRYGEAEAVTRESLQFVPHHPYPYIALGIDLLALQRFDDARKIIQDAQSRKLYAPVLHVALYALGFLGDDSAAMAEQQGKLAAHPEYENYGFALASDTEAYVGHVRKARKLNKRAVESAVRADNKENGAIYLTNAALQQAAYGNAAEARQTAAEGLKLAASQGAAAEAAIAFAMAGDTSRAESLAQDLRNRRPLDTQMQLLWLPAIQAQLTLDRKNPPLALNTLQAASAIELGQTPFTINISCLYYIYIRGNAYLAAGQGSPAAAEFQKILDHNGIVWNCWTGALAHLGVARAYAMQGDTAEAKAAYQDFLTLWKDADPDIPILIAAKSEYAKLK
jgi:eukaryotic-like serine/threonine-protein kinase